MVVRGFLLAITGIIASKKPCLRNALGLAALAYRTE